MKILVNRIWDNGTSTIGLLYINGKLEGVTCEDEKRAVKVKAETRIPEGVYKIGFRKEGTHHVDYLKKYPAIHKGMLHILDVPNFQYILIHIGNTEKDTEGCLLIGNKLVYSGIIEESTAAYLRIYPIIASALEKEEVTIEFKDIQPR